jgi:hypothetical protein
MRRFRSVATKYRANYLGWRRMVDRHGESPPRSGALSAALA